MAMWTSYFMAPPPRSTLVNGDETSTDVRPLFLVGLASAYSDSWNVVDAQLVGRARDEIGGK